MNAWVMVGSAWPTFSVPGISSSGTSFRSLKIEVVGANEPMPSVSKKFVTKPMAARNQDGRLPLPVAPRLVRARRTQ